MPGVTMRKPRENRLEFGERTALTVCQAAKCGFGHREFKSKPVSGIVGIICEITHSLAKARLIYRGLCRPLLSGPEIAAAVSPFSATARTPLLRLKLGNSQTI